MRGSGILKATAVGYALAVMLGDGIAADPTPPPQTVEASPEVTGSFTMYGWLPFMEGDTAVNGVGPAHVSLDPAEILDILDFTVMASGDVRRGRFGLFGDFVYLKVSDGRATPGPLFSDASLSVETVILTAAGTYQLLETDTSWLQAIAGARYWMFDTSLTLSPGVLPGVSASERISWVDPVVGLRGRHALNDKVFVSGTAAIGGFGAGSDFMWDVVGAVGYRFNDRFSMSAGYRALGVDYEKDGDIVDLVNHGPIFGFSVSF